MESVWISRAISFLGIGVLLLLAWALSENRGRVPWRVLFGGLALQFVFALLILRTRGGEWFFARVKDAFDVITAASDAGAQFVFGDLVRVLVLPGAHPIGGEGGGALVLSAVIAFKVLPVIIFVSALAAILQHFGIIQIFVRTLAWCMRYTLGTSGAETFGAALQVFFGIESSGALKSYMPTMTRSEIFVLMVSFLASIAASVMVAYAGFGAQPGHLLAASIMSAPAAIVFAKLMVPELGRPETAGGVRIAVPRETHNVFDAAAAGGQLGLQMALGVGAMLIVFVGLIHLLDGGIVWLTGQTLQSLAGYLFIPFAFILGVPSADVPEIAELLAVKSIFNEFLAYQSMQPLVDSGSVQPRSVVIATYALCGFANPGSIGIMLGAMSALVPERRAEFAGLSLRAFAAGTFATFSTACVAGVLT